MRILATLFVSIIIFAGCTATLPPKSDVSSSYSVVGLKSYSLKTNCEQANVDPAFNKTFLSGYCEMLQGSTKLALQKVNPALKYTDANSDMNIDVQLEELHGGNAAARFWIGFGAGRSVSTVFVKVFKGPELMSESRITETTTLTNLMTGTYENEDALMQDVPLLAKKIAEFVNDPVKFKRENPQ
jgi:hypothetical protein